MSEYSTSNSSGRYTSKKYNASPNPGGRSTPIRASHRNLEVSNRLMKRSLLFCSVPFRSFLLNGPGTRGGNTRARLLASKKVSAPLPLNLPSLRREHASGSDHGSASPNANASGWGSSPAEESVASPPQAGLSPASPPHRAWSATATSKPDSSDHGDSRCMNMNMNMGYICIS